MSPRTLLIIAFLLAGAGTLPAQGLPEALRPLPEKAWTWDAARHLLNRAGFGGTKSDIDALYAMGLEGAVNHLVDYQDVPAGPVLEIEPVDRGNPRDLRAMSEDERRTHRRQIRRANGRDMDRVRNWWMTRMVETDRPLEEKMTLFWHGHFTSGFRDVRNAYSMATQNALLRKYATSSFREMVRAVARDPAMLEYLDNNRNRRRQPNENFARELLELFTMGVGNYTEKDIKEAARAFTGWSMTREGKFVFRDRQHDYGEKEFLGRKGRFDGDDIIDIVLEQDVVADYIAGKIFRFFAYEDPEPRIIDALGARLRKKRRAKDGKVDYRLRPVLKTLFKSRAFYSEAAVGTRVKGPVELTVGAIRQLELPTERTARIALLTSSQMGQQLFEPPNVKGWDGGRDWISTSSLYHRYNFAGIITRDLPADAFRLQAANNPEPAEGEGMSSGAVGGEVRGDELVPTGTDGAPGMVDGKKEGEMEDDARARTVRRLRQRRPSETARAVRLRFPFKAAELVKRSGAKTAGETVDWFASFCLSVPLSHESRQELIAYLGTNLIGEPSPFDSDRWDCSRRVKGMLHLMFSTPEYQIN